jgi:hypothetical protein
MGGNNIANADNVQAASEQLAAGDVNGMPGALQIGSNFFYGDGTNVAIRTPGTLVVQNQNGTASAPLNSGAITSSSQIVPGAVATVGAACGPNGAFAANTNGTGQDLDCENGTWQTQGGTGVVDVNLTGSPYCTAGTTGILDFNKPYSASLQYIYNIVSELDTNYGSDNYGIGLTTGYFDPTNLVPVSCEGGMWQLSGEQ